MARKPNKPTGEIKLDLGELYDKQWQFIESTKRYTAYGGARGGGKSHVAIRAAIKGALEYPGIKILFMRRKYGELEKNIIIPMNKLINSATMDGMPCGESIARYNGTMRILFFTNGSMIVFGHLNNSSDVEEYQGLEYDWIFMEEATNFTYREFRMIGAAMRGANKIPKHFYLTCNPGGIGHYWVKRLFVDRQFEEAENPDDYSFIQALVTDNKAIMEHDREYLNMLDAQPEEIRNAWRFGDWDGLAGFYFKEFKKEVHTCKPFLIPEEWPKYRAFDYGLDMFACYWFAIDFNDRVWVYREYCESGLIVSEAAEAMRRLTPPDEHIQFTVAPPDMWTTQKDTGRTMAEVFMQNGIGLVRANNQRIQGWMVVKEYLKIRQDNKPGIIIFDDCVELIQDLPTLMRDEKNINDCAKEPHDITHSPDAIRYGLIYRTMGARLEPVKEEYDDDQLEDYDEFMTGGDASDGYMSYGG